MSIDSIKKSSQSESANNSSSTGTRVRYVLPQGCRIGGIYEIVKPLGRGGMGEVYLARHTKLDIYRAIKILLPKIAAKNPMFAIRFMQEARLAIQLQHPNIINVMDANHDEKLNIYYIVMELVDGASLKTLIKKSGAFDEVKTLQIAFCVGMALAEADQKNIVHRDIKPDNIMLTREDKVKLADLGIAKSTSDGNQGDLTAPEILIGTPAYVSPEQAQNAQSVDRRADIYSLGVSMYEMLAGEKPYKGSSTIEIINQLFNAPVPDIRAKNPVVSGGTAQLIMEMMSKEREMRPADWGVFCQRAKELLESLKTGQCADLAAVKKTKFFGKKIKSLVPQKVIANDGQGRGGDFKRRLKKSLKILIPSFFGFVICMLLMSGFFSAENFRYWKRRIVLQMMGAEYRQQCEQYNLDPPLQLVFANDVIRATWLSQNKPADTPEVTVTIASANEEQEIIPATAEYRGRGVLLFTLEAPPEVENYIKEKGYQLEIAGKIIGRMNVKLPGQLEVPAGKYRLQMLIPECKSFGEVAVDLKRDEKQEIKVAAIPTEGVLTINCNVPDFQVWWSQQWLKTRELRVDSLKNIDLVLKAPGYKTNSTVVKLIPGERRELNIILEPLPETVDSNSAVMVQAEQEYKAGNYFKAKKLFTEEAAKNNRIANFRLGEIYENGYVEWIANKVSAYRYYRAAADLDYPPAIFKVGLFHENGLGNVPQNDKEALKWYRRGAELDYIPCLNRIGKFYENGMGGVSENIEAAIEYYMRSAAKNDLESQYNLGRLYEQQMISASSQVQKDNMRRLARRWYEEPARQGYADAKVKILNL